jgi:hypothetical protein
MHHPWVDDEGLEAGEGPEVGKGKSQGKAKSKKHKLKPFIFFLASLALPKQKRERRFST